MIKLDIIIIVEGKHDYIKISSIIDAPIIATNGFRIFKDREKIEYIKRLSDKKDILIITDSDSAGFVIRNFLKNIVQDSKIFNAYIPQIKGKEKRKEHLSKEGLLGVEAMSEDVIFTAIKNSGILLNKAEENIEKINKIDFYNLGLTGKKDSKEIRLLLTKKLNLPSYLSTNALIETLNIIITKEELTNIIEDLTKS